MILDEDKAKIDHWIKKFPEPKGAVLMALRILQDREGWLSDASIKACSEYLKIDPVDVYEVVSFYSLYRRQPGGERYLKVCTGLSCCLTGATDMLTHLSKTLGVEKGETTRDGKITLLETECLGACVKAPCVLVDDQDYHLHMTPEKLNELVRSLQGDLNE